MRTEGPNVVSGQKIEKAERQEEILLDTERAAQIVWETGRAEEAFSREALATYAEQQGISRKDFLYWLVVGGLSATVVPKGIEAKALDTERAETESLRTVERFKGLTEVDLRELAKQFHIDLEVENGNGRYVVFLPQFHHLGGDVRNTAEKNSLGDLVAYHKELEVALERFAQEGAGHVFSEGVYDTAYFEKLKALSKKVERIEPKPGALKAFMTLYDEARALKRCGSDIVVYILLSKFCQIDSAYDAKEEYRSLDQKDFNRLHGILESFDEFIMDVGARDQELLEGEAIRGIAGLMRPKDDLLYMWGADVVRYMRDRGDIAPAELRSTTLETDLLERVYNRGTGELTEEERKKVFDIRESVAVDLIGRGMHTFNPLLYGNAHRFKTAVEAYNKKHPDAPLGLLTITPKKVTVRGRRGAVDLCPEGRADGFGMRLTNRGATH